MMAMSVQHGITIAATYAGVKTKFSIARIEHSFCIVHAGKLSRSAPNAYALQKNVQFWTTAAAPISVQSGASLCSLRRLRISTSVEGIVRKYMNTKG